MTEGYQYLVAIIVTAYFAMFGSVYESYWKPAHYLTIVWFLIITACCFQLYRDSGFAQNLEEAQIEEAKLYNYLVSDDNMYILIKDERKRKPRLVVTPYDREKEKKMFESSRDGSQNTKIVTSLGKENDNGQDNDWEIYTIPQQTLPPKEIQ